MSWVLSIIGGLVALVLVVWTARALPFNAELKRQERLVLALAPPTPRPVDELPPLMRAFAEKGLAGQGGVPRAVRLGQDAEMLLGDTWSDLTARQVFGIGAPAFAWIATMRAGPLPLAWGIDRFTQGQGALEMRLLGAVPVADLRGSDADVGEAMRYLIELLWIPDAILSNPELSWQETGPRTVEVSMEVSGKRIAATFHFDAEGDVVEMTAKDRPDVSDGVTVLRDWRGVVADYGEIGGRRVPMWGEVGYVTDGTYAPYFRARIRDYALVF